MVIFKHANNFSDVNVQIQLACMCKAQHNRKSMHKQLSKFLDRNRYLSKKVTSLAKLAKAISMVPQVQKILSKNATSFVGQIALSDVWLAFQDSNKKMA